MQIKIIDTKFDQKIWNEIVSHPLQSWEWGEARKKMGIGVLRIVEFSSVETRHASSLQNAYQITFHRIPFTNFKIGYLPRSNFPTKQVLEFLYDYGRKNNVVFIKIEPYEEKSKVKSQKSKVLEIRNWKLDISQSPHPLFPSWTQILDLTKSEDQLLKNMHHKTRYNIRLAKKKGVVVKEMSNNEGFNIFAKLYFETCRRQKYFGHNQQYHKIVWKNLKNKISHILIAYYRDIPLAAYQLFYFKDVLYYVYGGTSDQHKNLMASNLLMWEAILLGKKIGAKRLDMWGSLSPDYNPNDPWAGFTRFKQGYGGKFVEFVGSYDLVINPSLYQVYNITYKLRNFFLSLKHV